MVIMPEHAAVPEFPPEPNVILDFDLTGFEPADLEASFVTDPEILQSTNVDTGDRQRRFPLLRKVAALGLAVTATIVPSALHQGAHHTEPPKHHRAINPVTRVLAEAHEHPYPDSHDLNMFQPLPSSAYVTADKVLALPDKNLEAKFETAEYDRQQKAYYEQPFHGTVYFQPNFTGFDYAKFDFEAETEAAKEAGVTVVDPLPTLRSLANDTGGALKAKPDLTVNQALALTQNYLAKFDIHLDTADEKANLDWKLRPINKQDDPEVVKDSLLNLVQATSELTTDYIAHITGGKGLDMTLAGNKKSQVAAYAITGGDHDQVVFNVSDDVSSDTERHELYHLEDAAEAGGPTAADNDMVYIDYNGGQNTYTRQFDDDKDIENPQYDRLTFYQRFSASGLERQEYAARNKGNWKEACQIRADEDKLVATIGGAATTVSSYSTTFPAEDKAELGKDLTGNGYAWDVDQSADTPSIHAKFKELLARYAYFDPRDAVYDALINNHTQPSSVISPTACDTKPPADHGK
jgi:hypothetical protein